MCSSACRPPTKRAVAGTTLGALAERFGLRLVGEPATPILGVCTLSPGLPGYLSFLANPKYRPQLAGTKAAAVVLGERDLKNAAVPVLVARDPYLAFARIARLFDPEPVVKPGIHPSAVIAADATVDASAEIGPLVVIESGAVIGPRARIGAQSFIGAGARIGADTRLEGQNWIGPRCEVGARCRLNPGCVVGGRGFGLAPTSEGWEEVPQLGRVILGDDVELGANTCVDRGAIEDTLIADGVKIDNLVQIAHNVRVGARTAIAGNTGIAGSTVIGEGCLIGGAVGINGHIRITDGVVIQGRAMVTNSILDKGVYASGLPLSPAREWRRQVARIRRLERTEARLKALEARLGIVHEEGSQDDEQPD